MCLLPLCVCVCVRYLLDGEHGSREQQEGEEKKYFALFLIVSPSLNGLVVIFLRLLHMESERTGWEEAK